MLSPFFNTILETRMKLAVVVWLDLLLQPLYYYLKIFKMHTKWQ
jgi:hypothetical protein